MDGSNNTSFQSVVILGLKTALLEAQDEISRIRKERDEARKKVLQLIQANSKFQVEIINSNQLATKLKSMLKKLRSEFEEHKKEMTDKEHDNVNLGFKVKELKSLLDIKTELLESLNIKGDRMTKDEFFDYRANYKTLMRHLKLVIKNQPCYPDKQLLEDIQNVISKTERGKPANLSKYLVKKPKSCDDDDEKHAEIGEDFGIRIRPSTPLSNCFKNRHDNCAEKVDSTPVPNDCSTKAGDLRFLDDDISSKTNLVAEKPVEICDKPVVNVEITGMPQLQCEDSISVISSGQKDEKDIGTMSDSESDKTSGFCDIETEVESPSNMELSSHARNTPSPENQTMAMCMPDLLLSINTEKSTPTKKLIEKEPISKTPISSNSKILKNDVKSPSPIKESTISKMPISSNSKIVKDDIKSPSPIEKSTISKTPISSNSKSVKDDVRIKSPSPKKRTSKNLKDEVEWSSPKKKNVDSKNTHKVLNILEEMKTLKTTMICQVTSLELFHDETSLESNSCFKRPTTVPSSHRESMRKNRNSAEDAANFVPKRSSQLVKRDPCSRKKIVDRVSDDELYKKPDPSISERNDTKAESLCESNLTSEVCNSTFSPSATEKLQVCESLATEDSSSLRDDVISGFEKPIETAAQSLPQLLAETEVPSAIDTEDTLNETASSLSDDETEAEKIPSPEIRQHLTDNADVSVDNEVVTGKIETPEICQHLTDDADVSVDNELTNELENSRMESLPCIEELVTDVSDTDKQTDEEEQRDDVLTKENESIPDEPLDNILPEKISSDIDEKSNSVSTKESNAAPEECFDSLLSKKARLDVDEKPNDVSMDENNTTSEECLDITSSDTVLSDIDEKPASQSIHSSTFEPKETMAISESSNESTAPEITSTEEKVSSDIDEKPASQSTHSSTSEPKETIAISESSNESTAPTAPEITTTEEKISEDDVPKKRGRPKKASSVTKPKSQKSPSSSKSSTSEPIAKKPKTTRRTSTRSKTTAAPSPTVINLRSSDTMNNGMERRKRKGKFNEILDSLRSRSKRSKSDYPLESPELVEDVKPVQRRGRKRKTSLPVETLESATQTNWSPRSESVVSRITERISELEENSIESETKSEASLQNVQNEQQIDDQTSSATMPKDSGYLSDEIPVATETDNSVTKSENRPPSSILESCNFVPISVLGKLIDMSKIIQEKVATVVESKRKMVAAAKVETCSSLGKENVPEARSPTTNQPESLSSSELEHRSDHISSLEPENCIESSIEATCQLSITPEAELKRECVSNSSDSSSESENGAESCKKSTAPEASELEPISVANLKQDQSVNSPNSSLEIEKCKEPIPKPDIIHVRTENRAASVSGANLKQEYFSCSSSESENDEETTSSKTETILSSDLKQERLPAESNSSSEVEKDQEEITSSKTETTCKTETIPSSDLKQKRLPAESNPSSEVEKNEEEIASSKTETTCKTETIPSSDLKQERLPAESNSSSEVKKDQEEITSSSTEPTCKTEVIPSTDLKQERVADPPNSSSPELEIVKSTLKSSTSNENQAEVTPVPKLEQNVASNSSPETEKVKEPRRSIFDSDDDESPIEMSSKKASPAKRIISEREEVRDRCSITSSWDIDSDDEPPTEVPFKKITSVDESPPRTNIKSSPATIKEFKVESPANEATTTNDSKPETTTRVRYEEEFSNSSGLSSQVSELDANIEMISQFENVRTPPKVKDLFDSTDDENSNPDVFSILEEMKSASLCLSQKKHELAEFSRRLSPISVLEPALAPPIIPPLEKYQMYSPPQRRLTDEPEIKDEYDSEDEMLVIAEGEQVINDNCGAGIEINKFNCHDTNYNNYAFPSYTNTLAPSSMVNDQSSRATTSRSQTFTKQMPEMNIEKEIPAAGSSSAIKFEFYKENFRTEKDDGAVKVLSPFESIWPSLKSLFVRKCVKEEGATSMLVPCCHSVPQLAFFYRIRETDTKPSPVRAEQNEVAGVEKLIDKYLANVRRNEYVAVKDFKMSVNSSSAAISEALTNTVLKFANRNIKELKELLGYLANLCVDLETDHPDFITEMQTALRDLIFVDNWSMDKNNGAGQVTSIISMSVLFTMLSQRSNNLKSVKDLLLEALCSFKFRAHPIAYGVLNAWSAVFNDASRNCLLTRIILFSLLNHSMDRNLKLYKVIEVRELITQCYRVKLGDKTAEDHVKEAMLLFDDDTWVDAIVLLCKRKLFPWSYTNVIMKYLIQIVDRWKEYDFNEMILIKTVQALHKILLSCPMKAVQGSNKAKEQSALPTKQLTYNINPILETLSNVLQCAKGSRELRETVAVAICGVSHLNFELCSAILSKWDPPEGVISNKALEEMHLIMHKYKSSYKPNVWLRVILPRDERPKTLPNRRNMAPPHKPNNGDYSNQQRHQYPVREKNFTNHGKAEPPPFKKKKKKKKSKQNKGNPEQKKS